MKALCVCLLALSAAAAAAADFTISSYTASALASSPQVRRAEEGYEAASAEYKRAVADMVLPTAAFSGVAYPYGYNPNNDYEFNTWRLNRNDIALDTTFNWNLFNSFQDEERVRLAKAGRQAAEKALEAARQDRAYAAIQAFYDLDAKTELLAVAREDVDAQRKQLDQSRDLYSSGHRGEADLLKSETDWRSSQLRQADAESARRASLVAFNALLDRPRFDEAALQLDLSTAALRLPDVGSDLTRAVEARPEVQAAGHALEQSRIQVQQAVRGILPNFRIDATWNHTDTANFGTPVTASNLGIPNPNYYLSLSLSLPFGFNGVSQALALVEARAARKAAQEALQQAQRGVRDEVAQAYVGLQHSMNSYALAQEKAEISRRALALVSSQYSEGMADAVRMNQAQTDFLDARVSRALALREIFIGRAQYERAVGARLWRSIGYSPTSY